MNGSTWEEETLAGIRNRLALAQQQRGKAEQEADYWRRHTDALEKVLELERQHRGIKINGGEAVDAEILRHKSVREALIEIGQRNNGKIVVQDAVKAFIEAGAYQTRDLARNAIYSTLGHGKKKYFERLESGVYRLKESAEGQPTLVL